MSDVRIEEYRRRVKAQPTDENHRLFYQALQRAGRLVWVVQSADLSREGRAYGAYDAHLWGVFRTFEAAEEWVLTQSRRDGDSHPFRPIREEDKVYPYDWPKQIPEGCGRLYFNGWLQHARRISPKEVLD